MHRKKKIVYLSHCILNQNSVIRDWERAPGAFNNIVKEFLEQDIGIIQLPCPEFTYLGESRPPKTKEEYDTPVYRKLCNELTQPIIRQMKEYYKNGYEILGVVGIGGSPSCDILGSRGIFMEEFLKLADKENFEFKLLDIPEEYQETQGDGSSVHFAKSTTVR